MFSQPVSTMHHLQSLEKIVYNHIIGLLFNIYIYIYIYIYISVQFLSGHSSLQHLAIYLSLLIPYFRTKNTKQWEMLYTCVDICKAFDTISHHKLLAKFQNFGISGNLLRWFQDKIIVANVSA